MGSWYDDRTYTDSFGNEVRAYDDGADMPSLMEVQEMVYQTILAVLSGIKVRTGQKDNYATNLVYVYIFPLDGGFYER